MDFKKLFEAQAELEKQIKEQHPVQKGENRLLKKVLAIQVELAECAQNWRGFKFWSKHQTPTVINSSCKSEEAEEFFCGICHKYYTKDDLLEFDEDGDAPCPSKNHETNWLMAMKTKNPTLEEYADVLHFALGIGLELGIKVESVYLLEKESKTILERFTSLMVGYGILGMQSHHIECSYRDLFAGTIRLGIKLGFTLEQIEEAYYAKNKINHERQAVGY